MTLRTEERFSTGLIIKSAARHRNLEAEDWQCPPEEPKKMMLCVSQPLGKDSSLDAGYFSGNGADVLKLTGM